MQQGGVADPGDAMGGPRGTALTNPPPRRGVLTRSQQLKQQLEVAEAPQVSTGQSTTSSDPSGSQSPDVPLAGSSLGASSVLDELLSPFTPMTSRHAEASPS